MIKIPQKTIFFLSLLLITKIVSANTDTVDIGLDYTHTNYLHFVGTAVGASRMFDARDIKPRNGNKAPKITLGTLGLESNLLGNCQVSFSTLNNFKLRHVVTNKKLARYRLWYRNKKFTRKRNKITLPCNTSPTVLKFSTTKRFKKRLSGIYRDVISVVVTTE